MTDKAQKHAAMLDEARVAQSHQNYRRSIRIYEAMIVDDPRDPLPHHRLGELLLRRGDQTEGLASLRRALALYEARSEGAKASAIRRMLRSGSA